MNLAKYKKSSEKYISEDEILFPLPKQSEEPEGICKDSIYQIRRNAKKMKRARAIAEALENIISPKWESMENPKNAISISHISKNTKSCDRIWHKDKISTIDHQGNKVPREAYYQVQESLYSK